MHQKCFAFVQEHESTVSGLPETESLLPADALAITSIGCDDFAFRTALSQLEAYERSLLECSRGYWMDNWIDEQEADVLIPQGLVYSINYAAWEDVVGFRLVHIVG